MHKANGHPVATLLRCHLSSIINSFNSHTVTYQRFVSPIQIPSFDNWCNTAAILYGLDERGDNYDTTAGYDAVSFS